MHFEKKKIRAETLGEYLSAIRQNLNLTVEEVSGKTNIKAKFLTNLELGNFSALPPYVYVMGFLKQLALLYNLEPDVLIGQYRKESGIHQQLAGRRENKSSKLAKIIDNIVITPKKLSLFVGALFVAVTLIYIVWQVLSINRAPSLEIFEPLDRQIITQSFITIRGKTGPGMSLTVNDQNIFVDSRGNFKTQLGLTAGPKELKFVAKNKFDKSVSKTIAIIGENKAAAGESKRLQLKLDFLGDVILDFAVDDEAAQAALFKEGETKVLSGSKKIVISTSDAGKTRAALNGQVVGILGRPGEKLSNISFFQESGNIK